MWGECARVHGQQRVSGLLTPRDDVSRARRIEAGAEDVPSQNALEIEKALDQAGDIV